MGSRDQSGAVDRCAVEGEVEGGVEEWQVVEGWRELEGKGGGGG